MIFMRSTMDQSKPLPDTEITAEQLINQLIEQIDLLATQTTQLSNEIDGLLEQPGGMTESQRVKSMLSVSLIKYNMEYIKLLKTAITSLGSQPEKTDEILTRLNASKQRLADSLKKK